MYKTTIFFFYALLLVQALSAQSKKTELPSSDFQQMYKETNGAILIDVRSAEEMESGFIESAGNLDLNSGEFEEKLSGLDKNKTYFLYCLSGIRSGRAADLMRENGFGNVYTLEGGMKAWNANEMPVKQKP